MPKGSNSTSLVSQDILISQQGKPHLQRASLLIRENVVSSPLGPLLHVLLGVPKCLLPPVHKNAPGWRQPCAVLQAHWQLTTAVIPGTNSALYVQQAAGAVYGLC